MFGYHRAFQLMRWRLTRYHSLSGSDFNKWTHTFIHLSYRYHSTVTGALPPPPELKPWNSGALRPSLAKRRVAILLFVLGFIAHSQIREHRSAFPQWCLQKRSQGSEPRARLWLECCSRRCDEMILIIQQCLRLRANLLSSPRSSYTDIARSSAVPQALPSSRGLCQQGRS